MNIMTGKSECVRRYAAAKIQIRSTEKQSFEQTRKMSLYYPRPRLRVQLKIESSPMIKMMTCTNQNFWPRSSEIYFILHDLS